jgi:hypothetical protein
MRAKLQAAIASLACSRTAAVTSKGAGTRNMAIGKDSALCIASCNETAEAIAAFACPAFCPCYLPDLLRAG